MGGIFAAWVVGQQSRPRQGAIWATARTAILMLDRAPRIPAISGANPCQAERGCVVAVQAGMSKPRALSAVSAAACSWS